MTPITMLKIGQLPNRLPATAPSSRSSAPREKGATPMRCSWSGSEWPRGGSLTTSLTISAMITPGAPTAMKATRQPKFFASQPPATAPIMPPSGMPKA